MTLDRRKFLIGLFGTAAVVAAGPLTKAIEKLSDQDFVRVIQGALPANDEIYGKDGKYVFAQIEWLDKAPYVKVIIPEGFRPLREESNRIGAEAIARMLKENGK